MPKILDGKKLAQEIELILQQAIESGLEVAERPPGLAVLRVGNDPASGVYVNYKEKACDRIGVRSFAKHLKEDISLEELTKTIESLNQDRNIDGILLQLPLPAHLDESILLRSIDPDKDADGLHPLNLGRLIKGEKGPRSCTPAGVISLLKRNQIKIEGKRAIHSSLGAAAFVDKYTEMEGNGNLDEYSNEHPVVRIHPETKKKILFVNSMYTKRIIDMDKEESDEILKKIFEHQERLDFTCRFKWTENAVAIWDNRSTQHQGLTDFFPGRGLGHERIMDRIAIEGDHPQ